MNQGEPTQDTISSSKTNCGVTVMRKRLPTAGADPLRTLFGFGRTADFSDQELLDRHLNNNAEGAKYAYRGLIDRHGQPVRHVCRSILGDPQDAADLFQVTFLTLAKRASEIRSNSSMVPRLSGVPSCVSIRAQRAELRRREVEHQQAAQLVRSSPSVEAETLWIGNSFIGSLARSRPVTPIRGFSATSRQSHTWKPQFGSNVWSSHFKPGSLKLKASSPSANVLVTIR